MKYTDFIDEIWCNGGQAVFGNDGMLTGTNSTYQSVLAVLQYEVWLLINRCVTFMLSHLSSSFYIATNAYASI